MNEKDATINEMDEIFNAKTKDFDELTVKCKGIEEMVNSVKGFKPGTTDFDKMQARINKLDNEVNLYKKVIQKNERDQKKEREEWFKEREFLQDNEVNLLAELRTVKEAKEK